jgi:hypothetical protein
LPTFLCKPDHPKAEYAPDGVLAGDWRLVRACPSGGRVKGWGRWWESPALVPHIGQWVWVQAGEYWVVWISVYSEAYSPENFICEIGEKS